MSTTNDFSSNQIFNNDWNGLYSDNNTGNTFTSNQFFGNNNNGLHFQTNTNNNTFSQNQFFSNDWSGLALETSSGNSLSDEKAYDNRNNGLYLYSISDNTISSLESYSNDYSGIVVKNSQNNLVYGGSIYSNKQHGVYLESASNNQILSVQSYSNSWHGIHLYLGSNNTLHNNQTYGNNNHGICFNASNQNTVSANTTFDNDWENISLWNSTNNILFSNSNYSNVVGGLKVDSDSMPSTLTIISDTFGNGGANTDFDIYVGSAYAHTLNLYNSTLASSTEIFGTVSPATASVISRKHDGSAGVTKIWGEHTIPSAVSETPQSEEVAKFNYANNLWEKSASAHIYVGTGTEDTNLNYDLSSASLGSGPYGYRLVAKTAGACTTSLKFDVFRNGTDVGDASCSSTYTDTNGGVNVGFKIDGGTSVEYAKGDTYTFTVWGDSGDTNTQKTVNMMQDGDVLGVASETTLELKGQAAGSNETTITRGSSGGYHINVAGTLDAQYYTMSYLGGTGGGLGLDLQSGATITNIANGTFNNFQNVGSTDTYLRVHTALIGTGAPTKNFSSLTFTEVSDGVPEFSVTESGGSAPSDNRYWLFTSPTCTGWDSCEDSDSEQNTTSGGSIRFSLPNSAPSAPQTPYVNNNSAQTGQASPVVGLTDTTPAFSAIFDDVDTADTAEYYQLQIGDDSDWSDAAELWDSNKTSITSCNEGDRCSDIVYAGSTLTAGQTFYWRIKFWDNSDAEGEWSTTQQFSMNNTPEVTNVTVNGGTNITLLENTTVPVNWTGTISDDNGSDDIATVQGKLYRSGVANAENCTPNDNNCYADADCTLSNCAGTSCTATCTINMQFHTDPTDTGSSYAAQYWKGWLQATDDQSTTGTGDSTAEIEVLTLMTIEVTSSITYGTLTAGGSRSDVTTVITNTGNTAITDLTLTGEQMCTDFPTCSGSLILPNQQQYSLSPFTYGTGSSLTATPTIVTVNITKPTSSPSNQSSTLYWGIEIPTGKVPGDYSGRTTVDASP